VFKLITIG